jgi:putative redox protein
MTRAHAAIGQTPYATHITVNGRKLVADEPEALGGKGAGFAPYDLLLSSLAACTAITLRMVADHKGWPLESLDIELSLSGAGDQRHIRRVLHPVGLDADQAARLADVAERTPVTLTLKSGIAIATTLA